VPPSDVGKIGIRKQETSVAERFETRWEDAEGLRWAVLVTLSPVLRRKFKLLTTTHRIIKRDDSNSFYAAIAAGGDLTDGVNPSVTVGDEIDRWKTRKQLENFDVLSLGGITRKQALTVGRLHGIDNLLAHTYRLTSEILVVSGSGQQFSISIRNRDCKNHLMSVFPSK
jgi:hypothetical protein